MPERDRKISIDKRFRSMFHDNRFKVKQTVDKRGRPVSHSTAEDLRRFYQLSESEEEEEGEEQEQEEQVRGDEAQPRGRGGADEGEAL